MNAKEFYFKKNTKRICASSFDYLRQVSLNKFLLNICLLEHAVGKPFYATENAAGIDLTAGINSKILIKKSLNFTRYVIQNKFFIPNNLLFPKSRVVLENYFN